MKSKKVLALMMGAIVASSVTSQTVVQVYAHDEGSSSSSYSYDDSIGISILDEEESSGSPEPMKEGLDVGKLTNFTSKRLNELLYNRYWQTDLSNLYISESKLVFELGANQEARLAYFDEEREFNENIVVPEEVLIDGKSYSVTSIGDMAFYDCENLENVTLPDSITRIGNNAFAHCNNLRLEALPDSLREIGNGAFAYCENLQLGSLPEKLEIICESAFVHCNNLQLKTLPDSLRKIGENAFVDCENLQLEELPENLREIGDGAFIRCYGLKLKKLPGELTRIGKYTFIGCYDLQLRTLPNNINEIGERAFMGCKNLPLEELPRGIDMISNHAFEGCENLQLKTLPANLSLIDIGAFAYCKNLQLASLPNDLEMIFKEAFVGCENLQLETLPEGLKIIVERAFADTGIRTITIPASVTELGDSAFDTNSIEEINLAQGSRLNNGDIERAYGRQLGRVLGFEVAQRQLRMLGQGIITPVELNAEDPEDVCSICIGEFNEENGEFGRLRCGHYMHLECFGEQVRSDFEQGVTFKCPICRREYNIFKLNNTL